MHWSGHISGSHTPETGANGGTRTPDQLITNQQLYQLSYVGALVRHDGPLGSHVHGFRNALVYRRPRLPQDEFGD